MINRINQLLKAKNISASQFADEIKIQRSGMSHILSGRNNPSLEFIMRVLNRYPEIDTNWLLFGKGEMYTTIAPENKTNKARQDVLEQQNLFDNFKIEKNIEESGSIDRVPIKEHIKKDLTSSKEKDSGLTEAFTYKKQIEKIVIFYNDKTFVEYTKEK